MDREERKRQITAELDQVISAVLSRHGDMTTKWVLLVEVIEADTSRKMLWTLTSSDIHAWDSLGMIAYAWQIEQAGTVAEHFNDEGG